MDLNLQKIKAVIEAGESLVGQGNIYSERIKERIEIIHTRSKKNRGLAEEWLQKLLDQWELQRFLQDCHELDDWVAEKMLMARDTSRDEAHKLHKKWLKHQAFMAELAQNKDWLEKIEKEGQQLIQEKPELGSIVRRKLGEIRECWVELESTTQAKARQLFEANKADVLVQSYTELDQQLLQLEGRLGQVDEGRDLTSVNKQLKQLQAMEAQMEDWYKEVGELQVQATSIPQQGAIKDSVNQKQNVVETRIVRLIEPLKERRRILLASKEVHQVSRDLEDEISLQRELQGHRGRVDDVLDRAGLIASIRSPEADCVRSSLDCLQQLWDTLRSETEQRQITLDGMYQAQQYYFDVAEVETWLSEQELHMMNEEKGKDEASTLQLLKKHLVLEQTIEDYAETIGLLSQQCRSLLELGHPDSGMFDACLGGWIDGRAGGSSGVAPCGIASVANPLPPPVTLSRSEQISKRQSQIDRLYVSLKDLVEERKGKLEQQYWLYQLNREVDELEQWIAEKEVVAGSPELGQDSEHVTLLQEKFTEFASETGSLGQERVSAVNQMADELIDYGHADAATIAEWKDGVNEAWADLLELMETRAQMLAASHQLHKFFDDCREVLSQIEDKQKRLPEVRARQGGSANTNTLQRLMQSFERDIQQLVTQVRQLQESAAQLRTVYAGEKAEAIAGREQEVMQAWKELLTSCEECRVQITTATDKLRFFGIVRDLISWMDSIICQIGTGEKPRDVSSVEVLMNYHQGLKNEIEARNKNMAQCVEMGKMLLAARNPATEEIKEKLEKVIAKQKELSEKWDKHWEWLQHMLEVHQFAQEAVVADAWLTAQEPFIKSQELGNSVDEVEQLIRRHEAFRKAAATWEERFSSLRRLTSLEKLKAEQSKLPPTPMLGRKVFVDPQEAGLAWTPSSVMRQTIYEQVEPKTKRHPEIASSSVKKLGSTTASSYTPVMNGTKYGSLNPRNEPKIVYVHQELKPEHLQPKIDHLADCVQPALEAQRLERERQEQRLTNPHREGAQELVNGTQEHAGVKASRSDLQTEKKRQERQTSSDQEIRARRDELPQERRRRDRRLERQSSSEEDTPPRKEELRRERHERKQLERQESSEQDRSEKRTGGEKRSTLADIVEQLQEREQSHVAAQVRERDPGPRLHNGLPERTPRPDRPRARDRPKPRRRPRPKDPSAPPGETRRSRSAPAQSTCSAPPAPPSHTAKQEGCMFRKHDVEIEKKSSNRSWVNLYCIVTNGEMGFYKDAKNTTATFNGEPIISLNNCICDVANGYKKKKNVFKLKTVEGSEFLFHTRDEMDLKNWVKTITTAISEHEEIAKWAQTQPTTSSTDESRKTAEERRLSVSSKKK
ncbi:Spectrin beta chain, non-erythrocytic 4 [Acipenser ruthenus]|uniref:Spectrin beta chain, non-erythrocytic 4 n=1 Tax=Acipenser ruthenus TaxID=7906 RepID=A0A444UJH3_ACIRT|nr:Spectrin beta chain, non-erythrocytic 4 [Acipenser ruthenus]